MRCRSRDSIWQCELLFDDLSIDPTQTNSEKALALAHEKAVTAVEHHPVATRVNNAKNQGAERAIS